MTEQYNELPTTSEFLVSLEETDHDESSDRISTLFPSTSFKIRGDPAGLAINSASFSSRQFFKTSPGKSVTPHQGGCFYLLFLSATSLSCSQTLEGLFEPLNLCFHFRDKHTETMYQNSYKGFNQNQGKPGGIIHCCASVCFCFDL